MITKEELDTLIAGEESFRVEKTIPTTNMDKFCEAICAFANDMPNSRQCGYLLIGVTDDGRRNGQAIFTIDRITVFEAKITQAREWPATTQNLPNPLPNPLPEILHLMQENPHITYTELASRLHISRESIRKHLKTLRDRYQLITRVGGTLGSWVTHTRPEK